MKQSDRTAGLRPFKKGQSGNPGGRVGVPRDIREAAQRHGPAAIEALAEIMQDGKAPAAARVSAATAILDRGYGKPAQAVTATLLDKEPSQMTRAELDAAIAALLVPRKGEDDAPEPEQMN